jgi:hypothetical protein
MEAVTTIRKMLANNQIFVPSYQRAYSWDIDAEGTAPKQISTFLSDLEQHIDSGSQTPYYFGHFLFEDKGNDRYAIIDGQQRLTTIVIFLSALFRKLNRELSDNEETCKEDIIKRRNTYRFETVDYDAQILKDYVIDGTKTAIRTETSSAGRIKSAYDYFVKALKTKDEIYIKKALDCVANASCTTHIVKSEPEAVQMFIFQNNRGKKPTDLEIVKADMMFAVHIAPVEKDIDAIIGEIKGRFEQIYKAISRIEYKIEEDEVLLYAFRVYDNSLWIERGDVIPKIRSELKNDPIEFAKRFTLYLEDSFTHLVTFFNTDNSNYEIASLIQLGSIGAALPFIIKAYQLGVKTEDKLLLASALESILLRQRLIGTRADINSRISEQYQAFSKENTCVKPIIDRIDWLKHVDSSEWWWAHWNDEALRWSVQGKINHAAAKFLLWKYEYHLRSQGKGGYSFKIDNPELEHIAPQTKNDKVASGYCAYDEEFMEQYLNCLGNFLLISKKHNGSIGNKPFMEKRETYTYLEQQQEVRQMTDGKRKWTKTLIKTRRDKIIDFIMDTF